MFSKLYIHLVTWLYILLSLDIVQPAGTFQRQNVLWYAQNPQCVPNSVFQNGKLIFSYLFSVKNTLDILSIKFKM